tara:strand:+ start:412 stop:909 length:498 start_codon:yes stop_codon:yes gene_type:complete
MKSGFRLGNIKFKFQEFVKDTQDFFKNKRVVLFSANVNSNSSEKLKNLQKVEFYFERIKKLGIQEIYCCSINNFDFLKSWFDNMKVKNVKFLPDENANFTKHVGMLSSNSEEQPKNSSKDYIAIITDGIVERCWEYNKTQNNQQNNGLCNTLILEDCINYLSATE